MFFLLANAPAAPGRAGGGGTAPGGGGGAGTFEGGGGTETKTIVRMDLDSLQLYLFGMTSHLFLVPRSI